MTPLNAEKTVEVTDSAASAVEGAIGSLVRPYVVAEQRQSTVDATKAFNVEGVTSLVAKVSGQTAEEIDQLIEELNGVRNFLRTEGKRVQRELVQYAQLNQTAMSSIQMISQSFAPLKGTNAEKQASKSEGSGPK